MDDNLARTYRWYGSRHAESAGEDLYRIAGRILSDLKTDQAHQQMPPSAALLVTVTAETITVQVHVHDEADFADMGPETIRARVAAVCERYIWRQRSRPSQARYRYACHIRTDPCRLDAGEPGSLLG